MPRCPKRHALLRNPQVWRSLIVGRDELIYINDLIGRWLLTRKFVLCHLLSLKVVCDHSFLSITSKCRKLTTTCNMLHHPIRCLPHKVTGHLMRRSNSLVNGIDSVTSAGLFLKWMNCQPSQTASETPPQARRIPTRRRRLCRKPLPAKRLLPEVTNSWYHLHCP